MRLLEAMYHLYDGRRIRCKEWADFEYLEYQRLNNSIVTESGEEAVAMVFLANIDNEWEIIK